MPGLQTMILLMLIPCNSNNRLIGKGAIRGLERSFADIRIGDKSVDLLRDLARDPLILCLSYNRLIHSQS